MAVTANLYDNFLLNAMAAKINYLSDTINVMLCTSSYTPNQATDAFKSSVTNEVVGTGYTAMGATLGTKTAVVTAANSWTVQWTATTAYTVGQIVRPATGNGHLYRCVIAGTSGASTPTFPTTSGATVVDNAAITWQECGIGAIQVGAATVSWASSTITARYAVIYDGTPGTDATRPLIGYINFGADVVSSSGTFTITWDPTGIFTIMIS